MKTFLFDFEMFDFYRNIMDSDIDLILVCYTFPVININDDAKNTRNENQVHSFAIISLRLCYDFVDVSFALIIVI